MKNKYILHIFKILQVGDTQGCLRHARFFVIGKLVDKKQMARAVGTLGELQTCLDSYTLILPI